MIARLYNFVTLGNMVNGVMRIMMNGLLNYNIILMCPLYMPQTAGQCTMSAISITPKQYRF